MQPPGAGRDLPEPIPLHPEQSAQAAPRIQHSQPASIPVEGGDQPPPQSLIRTIGSGSAVEATHDREALERQLQRPMNLTGAGATRCRTFCCKLTDAAIAHMDAQITQWLDASKAEVKFCSSTVGRFEGKHPENKLLVTVWY